MNPGLVAFAKRIYSATPSRFLRRIYFEAFCALVRNRKVTATIDGMTFDLDLGELIDVALFLDRYEPDVAASIDRYCRPGSVVLDVGANIGAHSLRFGKMASPAGKVFAFEPTSYAFDKLCRNISLNPGIDIRAFRIALSDHNLKAQVVSLRSSWRTDGHHHTASEAIEFVRLDDWSAEHRIERLDFVKLDVDGNEFPVIQGGLETLGRFRPTVFLEVASYHFQKEATNPLRLLMDLNYRFRDHEPGAKFVGLEAIRKRLAEKSSDRTFSINVIATTRELDDA